MREIGLILSVLAAASGCGTPRKWIRPMRPGETWQAYQVSYYDDKSVCSAVGKVKPRTTALGAGDAATPSAELQPDNILDMGDKAAADKRFSDCMLKRGWKQPEPAK